MFIKKQANKQTNKKQQQGIRIVRLKQTNM